MSGSSGLTDSIHENILYKKVVFLCYTSNTDWRRTAGDINPISFLKLFRMNRPVLAKMTLIAGCLQIAHEGK